MNLYIYAMIAVLTLGNLAASPQAYAVGGGGKFTADEGALTADPNTLDSDSLDFTYHDCLKFGGAYNRNFRDVGYLWISSYQDADSVVDSQINYTRNLGNTNGYRIYAKYNYTGTQFNMNPQPTPSGFRFNYTVNPNAQFELWLDPDQNTAIGLIPFNCFYINAGTADDVLLGTAGHVPVGERSETDGLANGDFELCFDDWVFTAAGNQWIQPLDMVNFNTMSFNGNITTLTNAVLRQDHAAEGSGNLFWNPPHCPHD